MNPLNNKKIPITRLSKWYDDGVKKYNLYGLFCPITNHLKYVGITIYPLNKRLSSHLSNPTNTIIRDWFNELKLNNKKPNIKLLKECENYEDLVQSEINTIKYYKDLGCTLFNVSEGLSQVEIGSIYGCSNKIINKFIKNNKNESTK